MKKRFFAGLLTVCLLWSLAPSPVLAQTSLEGQAEEAQEAPATENIQSQETVSGEEDTVLLASIPEDMEGLCGTSLTWTLTTDGVLTISGSGAMFDYSTSKRPEWYPYKYAIKTLVLSDDITHIGSYAFHQLFQPCNDVYIAEVNLPSKLESIGDYAFADTYKIENIAIPAGVTSVGTCAFQNACCTTGLKNGVMGTSQDLYGTLTLPAVWPEMGATAFGGNYFCHGLTVPAGTTEIVDRAFYGCRFQGELSLPEGLWSIGNEAFFDCGFTGTLTLPESLTDMGYGVFNGLDVTSVKIPESWTVIPEKTFEFSHDLTSVTIPAGIKEIGDYAFQYCTGLSSVSFPAGLERIGNRAFLHCTALTQVTLPDGLKALEDGAFLSSGLTSQPAWPSGLEELGGSVYKLCENMTGTGTLPGGALGDSASYIFQDSGISKAVIPDGVTRIPSLAFSSCENLTFVRIPASVTVIDDTAFYLCWEIAHVYYEGSQEDWEKITIGSYSDSALGKATLHCLGINHPPAEQKPVYESTTVKRTIRIFDPDNRVYPVPTGFTVEADGVTYDTEDKNYITLEIDKENPPDVTISKAGYRTYTLPGEQIGASNIVYLYQTKQEGPVIQAALLDKSSGSFICYSNLMQEQDMITLNSDRWAARTIYLRVDWNDCGEGRAYLRQSTGWQVELPQTQGYNENICLNRGLQPGVPIYLVLEAANGARTEKLVKLSVQSGTQPTVQLDLGDSHTQQNIYGQGGEKVDVFEGATLAMDLSGIGGGYLPVSFEMGEDGTIKGTIGLKGSDSASSSGFAMDTYNALSDALAGLGSGDAGFRSEAMNVFIQDAEKRGILTEATQVDVGIKGSIQVLGTFEGYLDEEWRPVISSAKLALVFSAGASYTQNYFVGAAPMYFTAAVKASLESAIRTETDEGGLLTVASGNSKTFTLGISVENGLGNPQVLSGGVRGSGNLKVKFDLPYDSNDTTWTLNASAAFVGSLLGFDSGKWVFWNSNELVLYQDGELLPDRGATLASLDLSDLEWVQAGREYLAEPSEFLANDSVSLMTVDDGQITDNLFKSNLYSYSVPQIITYPYSTSSERTVAIWLEDVTTRSAENRTGLYYSIYNGSSWSSPQLLPTGSDTADFAPTLQVVDGQPMALWMKADAVLASGSDVNATASHMDIAYGVPGSSTYQTIGFADGMDMLPTMWKDDSGLHIAFVHCPNGPFADGQEIWVYSEATEEYTKLAEGLSGIDSLTADGSGTLYYSVAAEDSQTLYRLTASGTSETVGSGGKPVWACGKLWWYDNGVIRSTGGDQVPAVEGSDWFLPLNFGGSEAVLFRGTSEDSDNTTLYLSVKDGSWGQLIPLLEAEGYLGDVSASVSSKSGKLLILANQQTITVEKDATGNDIYQVERADLMYYEVTPGMDLSVTGVTYDGTSLVPGGVLGVKVQLDNRGTETATVFQIDLYDGETLLGTAYAQETLAPGASWLLTADLPLPETLPDAVTVQVTPLMSDDTAPADNSMELALRLADVSVEEIASTVSGEDGTVETVVRVVNRGQRTLENISVSLHADTADGDAAANSQTITSPLEPGDVVTLSFTSAASDLAPGDLVYAVADLTEDQSAQENLLSNNTGFAMVQGGVAEIDTEFHVYASASSSEDGQASVVVSAENNSAQDVTASYYIALYDGDGRMVQSVRSDVITVAAGKKQKVAELNVSSAQGLTAKVFVLDAEGRPLLPAWSDTLE